MVKVSKKVKKILSTPKVKIQSFDPVKAISKGIPNDAALVSKGKEGFFNEEYSKEQKWLGEYSI